jgi:hypothetical protein
MPCDSRLRYVSVNEPSQDAEPLPRREQQLPSREPSERHDSRPLDGDPMSGLDGPPAQSGATDQPGDLFRPRRPSADRGQEPEFSEPLPHRGGAYPHPGQTPQDGEPLPQRGEAMPQRGEALPSRGDALPQRGQPPQPGDLLPRRTSRTRPGGRHRSPHRLTVASDAPSLVLAVPGAATPATAELADEIASATQLSCPGVDVRIGFLAGDTEPLDDALRFPDAPAGQLDLRAVVVPLLAGPNPSVDAELADAAGRAAEPVMLAAHLGPHPLLAEALHARLADAGLARAGRARGLSIVTGVNGVLVLADRGDEAIQAAGVVAVLLAARLAVPAVPASLGDTASVNSALVRLREAGASRPALSPCVIGPETPPDEIEAIRAMLGAPSAPPLGSHPAIAQLVAIRYGAALARLAMAGSAG